MPDNVDFWDKRIKQMSLDELSMAIRISDIETFRKYRFKCRQTVNLRSFIQENGCICSPGYINKFKDQLIENLYKGRNMHTAVFGPDDRKELFEVNGNKKTTGLKACAIMHESLLERTQAGYNINTSIRLTHSRRGMKLCRMENFYGQPLAAYCTSCAVHKNVAIIPRHALKNFYPDQMKLVYGFWYRQLGLDFKIGHNDVYGIKDIIPDKQEDLAFLILDSPVPQNRIVNLWQAPLKDQPVHAAGYPGSGINFNRIPLKVVDNARVKVLDNTKFECNLDMFRGNSGSPVFADKAFIGMFISVFSEHFISVGDNCELSCYCDDDECDLAVCIRADYIMSKLKGIVNNL